MEHTPTPRACPATHARHAPMYRGGSPRIYTHTQRSGASAHVRSAAEQQPTKLTAHGLQILEAPRLCGVSACGWCNIGATSVQHPRCFVPCAVQLLHNTDRVARADVRGRVSRARIMRTVARQVKRLDKPETAKNCSICDARTPCHRVKQNALTSPWSYHGKRR